MEIKFNYSPLTNTFRNVKNPFVVSVTDIQTILEFIKHGKFKEEIEVSRTFGKGHSIFDKIKTSIPTFTPNGTFDGKRTVDHLQTLTGFIYLDIDYNIDPEILKNVPFIYSYWKSFSGNGYGVLIHVSGLTKDNYKSSWSYLSDYFEKMEIKLDPHSKDISRQCVISYDPDIFINDNVVPLGIPKNDIPSKPYPSSVTLPDYQMDMTYNDTLKYSTTLDDYGDMDYVVIEEGKEYRNTYVPKVIEDGKRHSWLCSYTSSILFNNPTISFDRLEKVLYKVNKEHCHPNLSKIEVKSIVDWSFKKHREQKLKIKTKKKKVWINPEKKLDKTQKRKIVGQVSGRLRREKTLQSLIEIHKLLSNQYPKVTQKLLEQHSTVKIRTIKKYWKEIQEGVLY
jgi:hypothetical protein